MLKLTSMRRGNWLILFTSLFSVFTVVSPVYAQDTLQEWGYSKRINLEGINTYQTLFLDEQVYAGAETSLKDLRVVNSEGEFVPFYVDSGYGEDTGYHTSYESKLIRTFRKQQDTTFDFQIVPVREQTDIIGNVLTVQLPAEDFLKHVKVYGSYDGDTWDLVTEDEIYRTGQLEKDSIHLGSAHKFSFYRLHVVNNVDELSLTGLKLEHDQHDTQWMDYARKARPDYTMDQEAKHTYIVIPNEDRLKITAIRLKAEGNFKRSFEVTNEHQWTISTEGEPDLYHLEFKSTPITNTAIILSEPTAAKQLIITIDNQDDAPLDIRGVTINYLVHKLVFADQGKGPYRLLYGNSAAEQPHYDIINFKQHIEREKAGIGQLGPQDVIRKIVAPEESKPWWMQSKIWFNTAIVIVALLLIIVLVRKLN